MATLIEQLLGKMGLRDEPNMMSKTLELLRLLDLRSTNVPLQLSEYAKTLLCADIAATLLGTTTFDMEQSIKLSCLRKSHYLKHKRMVEKLLDLNKIVGINDICVQLNLMEVTRKANELMELYKAVIARENVGDIDDLIHPQYAAMAVFQACKINKCKFSKPKLMGFSNLRPLQWQQLELRWEKFLTKHYKAVNDKPKQTVAHDDDAVKKQSGSEANDAAISGNAKRATEIVEDYEKWKQRMLSMAENKLKLERQQQEERTIDTDVDMDKENFILGI